MNSITESRVKRLLFSHGFFMFGRAFFEIFLSIFIWKVTSDLSKVAWFNIIYLLTHLVSFYLFGPYVKRGHAHITRRIAIIGFALTYLYVFTLGQKAVDSFIPIALLIGIFNGMYWISYLIFRFEFTQVKNRSNYHGMEYATKISAGLIVPALGGFIIVQNYFGLSYSNIFLLGSLFLLVSFILGNVKLEQKGAEPLHLKKTFDEIRKDKEIVKVISSYALSGFTREGSLVKVLLPLFIFEVLRNEFHLGGWLSFFSFAGIITSISIGRFLRFKHYKSALSLGAVLFSFAIISLTKFPVLLTFILFGIVNQIILLFMTLPKRVIGDNMIHHIKNYNNHRVEYYVLRETILIGIGRIGSFAILLFVAGLAAEQLQWILIAMAFGVIIEMLILRSLKSDISYQGEA